MTIKEVIGIILPPALIAYYIFKMTKNFDDRRRFNRYLIELHKLLGILKSNMISLSTIAGIDRKLYIKYLTSIVDKFDGNVPFFHEAKIYDGDFIYFDRLQLLPELSEYLVNGFDANLKKNKKQLERKLENPNFLFDDYKYLIDNKVTINNYYITNHLIGKLNKSLDFYHEQCMNMFDSEVINSARRIHLLNFSVEYYVEESKNLYDISKLFYFTSEIAKTEIKSDLKRLNMHAVKNGIFFIVSLLGLGVFLLQ